MISRIIYILFISIYCYGTVLGKDKISGPNTGNFTSDHLQNLNVVYFIPEDAIVFPDYEKRISELMLWSQDWIKQQMTNNGYKNKTFGLLTDHAQGRIKIITIFGKKKMAQYPYEGGGGPVLAEVNAYFKDNKKDKSSLYTLMIIPRYRIKNDGVPDGGPFYGSPGTCFALDYEGLDIKHLGKPDEKSRMFGVWFGGLIHELGHGLGLPHNSQKLSENNDPNKGMALMFSGNRTLGVSPTFLTAADAALLNVNPIFNKTVKMKSGPNEWPEETDADITRLYTSFNTEKQSIVVSGRFKSNLPTTSILYYNDPNVNNEGTGTNRDYNAISWESKTIGRDSFYVEMPVRELFYKDGSPYELKIELVHINGTVTENIYGYHFSNGIPVFDRRDTRNELDKSGWKIASFSSEETSGEGPKNGRAVTLIDNNRHTFWHSRWTSGKDKFPHELVVSTGKNVTAKGFSLIQRSGLQRSVKDFEVMTSKDGISFVKAGSYTAANVNTAQYFDFQKPVDLRFFKILMISAHDGTTLATLAEAGLF